MAISCKIGCPCCQPTTNNGGFCHRNPERIKIENIDNWWCAEHPLYKASPTTAARGGK